MGGKRRRRGRNRRRREGNHRELHLGPLKVRARDDDPGLQLARAVAA